MADVEDLVAITKLNFRNITTTYFSTLLKINCFEAPFQTFMSKHIFATFEHKMVLKNKFSFFFLEKKYRWLENGLANLVNNHWIEIQDLETSIAPKFAQDDQCWKASDAYMGLFGFGVNEPFWRFAEVRLLLSSLYLKPSSGKFVR